MPYNISTIDGVIVGSDNRFPVDIQYSPHLLSGPAHIGQLDDSQIPIGIMRVAQHQLDPHTMVIDGRVVHIDGAKLDTIEPGAQVNNLTDQQAQSLTSGMNCNWHIHDNRYYTNSQLSTSGQATITWYNLINIPLTFPPSPHTHPDDSTIGGPYYTEVQLQTPGQSQIDWTNVINKPTFGGSNWLTPVESLYIGNSAPTMTDGFLIGNRIIWYNGNGSNQHIYTLTNEVVSDQLITPINGIPITATALSQIGFTCSNNNIDYTISNGIISTNIMNSTLNSSVFNVAASTHCPLEINFDFQFTNMNTRGEYSKFTLNVGPLVFQYKAKLAADPGNKFISLDGGNGVPIQFTNYWSIDQTWYNIRIEVLSTGVANVYYNSNLIITTTATSLLFNQLIFWFHGGNQNNVVQGINFRNLTVSGSSITGTWVDTYTPVLNDCVIVENDGVGNACQFWFNGTIWIKISDVDWGNHGSLSGLNNDDHLQYLNSTRHNAITGNPHQTTLTQVIATDSSATCTTSELNTLTNGSDASSLHDHDLRYYPNTTIDSKFLNYYTSTQLDNGQLDNRYYTSTQLDNGQLDNRYYTQNQVNVNFYTKTQLNNGQLDLRYYTQSQLNSNLGAGFVGVSGFSTTTVQTTLAAISSQVNAIVPTLNSVYDNGQFITATLGPVVIDTVTATTAPLQLTNKAISPTTDLAAGQIAIINNILYVYDGSRSKWLSPSKTLLFGRNGNSDGTTLRIVGDIVDENSGYQMSRNGTITSISLYSTGATVGKAIDIRLNTTSIYTFTTDSNGSYTNINLNLDFVGGDVVSIKVQPGGHGIMNTSAVIEYCHKA
jgi:hypothetical protein